MKVSSGALARPEDLGAINRRPLELFCGHSAHITLLRRCASDGILILVITKEITLLRGLMDDT